jgi:uncharacterized protein (DUF1684 family)
MTDEHTHDEGESHHHDEEHHDHVHTHMTPQEYALALRAAKDEYMRDDPDSPFRSRRSQFTGLRYYPYDGELALALPLDRDAVSGSIEMGTSTGESQTYPRVGVIRFEVDGQQAELTVYGEPDDLFLPIRDKTSGRETYGAGRYVSPTLLDDDHVFVDFNLLYNPYCAYNEQYSCPLPPVENWLQVPIRAGEQTYTVATSATDSH